MLRDDGLARLVAEDDDERLIDIRDAAQAALRFVKGQSAEDVANDELLAAALIQKQRGQGLGGASHGLDTWAVMVARYHHA